MRRHLLLGVWLIFWLSACSTVATPTATAPRTSAAAGVTVTPSSAPMSLATATTVTRSPTSSATPTTNALQISGLVQHPGELTVEQAKQVGSETVDVSFQSSKGTEQHRYTGVRLWAVLQQVGLQLDNTRKNDALRKYVVVSGRDGYEVVISLGEIDPNFGNRPILLAWEEDGTVLSGDRGPFRLVVPGDQRGGRYVSGVVKLDVRDVDSPPRNR